jgi:hypothetical protein
MMGVDASLCTGELGDEVVPDETTILRSRHSAGDEHGLTQAIFDSIAGLLKERRCCCAREPW